jgi:DNA segregation ATPase FtsK/SpoIIIE, S-DNA-T family
MIKPWCERQREALRAFRQAIVSRAGREREIAEGAQGRQHALGQRYAAEKERVEGEYAGAHADALTRAEEGRGHLHERQQRDRDKLEREYKKGKEKQEQEYLDAKAKLEAEFRDARWTTNTVYEADKRVAKEQMLEATAASKTLLKKLVNDWRVGRALLMKLEFLDDVPDFDPKEINISEGDPWARMQQCADQGQADLHALQTMRSPRFINGWLPWLNLAAAWLVLTAPGVFGLVFLPESWRIWLPTALTPALVLPIGYGLVMRQRRKTNDRIIALWLSLRNSAHLARHLRPVGLRLAKKTYLSKKRQSYKRNRELLKAIVESTRVKLRALRTGRDKTLRSHERTFKKRFAEQQEGQQKELLAVEETFARDQQEANDRHDVDAHLVETEHAQKREEDHHWHTQVWTALLRDWKSACDQSLQAFRSVAKDAEQWFPALTKPLTLPKALPLGLPIGTMRWTLDLFPAGVPGDPQLPRPDLSKIAYPALLPFPQRASLLYRANDEGKALAIDALQALLLRCWTAMPAGKVRCTIIDPVGRGENFSAFMHLADQDEKLVDGRIWTETGQIDERLTNLTVHMENVLQKYLRNQYETLAEYNAQAGEVAEPFHFLVVAHFPVNFSDDAARRLVSLASAGARCGIYTFVVVDTKQPVPHGFNIADLENVCAILDWQKAPLTPNPSPAQGEGRFVWEDDDFGMFPLVLEQSPPAQRCTELLQQVGEEAVRSSKVEVPFEWIMPPRDAWWTSDSASGIRVPIGRFGALGKQYLELGQGTSQHVLVAGKTGSGKSTLLHVLITQLAMFYSPSEIELYLIDFKKGVEFKAYASLSLPHARVIAVESEREFGLSVLQRLDGELSKRGEIYRTAGVNDLASYREYANNRLPSPSGRGGGGEGPLPHLARIMLIVDEFQEFFIEDDKLAGESSLLLDRLVRQGRAFGIHVLLGSQTIGGAYSLARSTIDQMAVRIALQCSEADAHLILSRDNTEARLLSRPGEGIYNALHGMLEGNHLFQVVWLNDSKRDDILRQTRDLSRQREDFLTPIVFEGAVPADITQNHLLQKMWREPTKPTATWSAWLGDAIAIKDPTAALFRKQSGSNVMILGQQEEIAVGLMVSSLVSLSAAVDPALAEPSIHLVIGQALDAASEELVKLLSEVLPIRLWLPRDLGALLNQLADEIDRRSQGTGPPQFVFLYGMQRLRDLRRPDDDFGFSKKGDEKTPYRQFTHVLKEGPPVGVFTMLWSDTLLNLQRCVDRPAMREFDQRVLMQMSAADSSTLMDNPIAAKLGPQRALFYTEDLGKIEKFRPYALPSVEWIQSLRVRKLDLTAAKEDLKAVDAHEIRPASVVLSSFAERLTTGGRLAGWFEGNDVYQFEERYYVIDDGNAYPVSKKDVEFDKIEDAPRTEFDPPYT